MKNRISYFTAVFQCFVKCVLKHCGPTGCSVKKKKKKLGGSCGQISRDRLPAGSPPGDSQSTLALKASSAKTVEYIVIVVKYT